MEKLDTKKSFVLYFQLVIIGGLHLLLLVLTKYTAWPEMLLWPYLILKGWLPYKDIAIAHTPLLLVNLGVFFRLFGVSVISLKIYTWILIILTDFLLFWVVKKLWNNKIAFLTLLFYIPLQVFYGGNGLWFDLALSFFALLTYYFLEKKNYKATGVLFMLAFFTKQTAFWFLIPIGIKVLLDYKKDIEKFAKQFVTSSLATGFLILFVIYLLGIFTDFWYWAIEFGIGMLPRSAGQIHLPNLRQLLISLWPFIIFLFLYLSQKRNKVFILFTWALTLSLGVFPRFELFHFQPGLPFVAMAGGLVLANFNKLKSIYKLIIVLYLLSLALIFSGSIIREWGVKDRFVEPDFLQMVEYVSENTKAEEEIYVLNSWDSVYALSNTLPASRPWIPHLSWYMELPGVQEKIVKDLKENLPELIIVGEYQYSGLGSYVPKKINNYIQDNYQPRGSVEGYNIYYLR